MSSLSPPPLPSEWNAKLLRSFNIFISCSLYTFLGFSETKSWCTSLRFFKPYQFHVLWTRYPIQQKCGSGDATLCLSGGDPILSPAKEPTHGWCPCAKATVWGFWVPPLNLALLDAPSNGSWWPGERCTSVVLAAHLVFWWHQLVLIRTADPSASLHRQTVVWSLQQPPFSCGSPQRCSEQCCCLTGTSHPLRGVQSHRAPSRLCVYFQIPSLYILRRSSGNPTQTLYILSN